MTKTPAVVIKLDSITGLQTARILSGYGIPVTGIVDDPSHFCRKTNCCEEIIVSSTSDETLLDTLAHLYEKRGESVLFPCSDDSVRVIAQNRERLAGHYRFVLPDYDVLDLLMNKTNLYKFAIDRGLRIPTTFFIEKVGDIDEITEKVGPPYIVKPAVKTEKWKERFRKKVLRLESVGELRSVLGDCLDAAGDVIVQKRIEGDDSCLRSTIFYHDSACKGVLTFTSRKLRQWHIEDGDGCLAEESRDEEAVKLTEELLAGVKFSGIGSIEFKREPSTGRYYIIEANVGRPISRISLVENAGVPVLYAIYCDALGLALPPDLAQRYTGAKWISLINDILSSIAYYRMNRLTFRQWRESLRGVNVYGVFSLRDPLPFIFQPLFYLKNYLKNPSRREIPR